MQGFDGVTARTSTVGRLTIISIDVNNIPGEMLFSTINMLTRPLSRNIVIPTTRRGQSYDLLKLWLENTPITTRTDTFHYEKLSDLYITLPTRDGSRRPYVEPQAGQPVPYGSQLNFFHARLPQGELRTDGTDGNISPPAPFLRRMWASGKMTWNNDNPMLVGSKVEAESSIKDVQLRGFEQDKPMVFVNQQIEYETKKGLSLTEERVHVYFEVDEKGEGKKSPPNKGMSRLWLI